MLPYCSVSFHSRGWHRDGKPAGTKLSLLQDRLLLFIKCTQRSQREAALSIIYSTFIFCPWRSQETGDSCIYCTEGTSSRTKCAWHCPPGITLSQALQHRPQWYQPCMVFTGQPLEIDMEICEALKLAQKVKCHNYVFREKCNIPWILAPFNTVYTRV